MIFFANDYNHGTHPAILAALQETNSCSYPGYGKDEWCQKGAEAISRYLDCHGAAIHFLEGGTQTNVTVIAAALRPYECVLSADTGHINVHETGAVEHTGHKVQTLPSADGKITAAQVQEAAEAFRTSTTQEHVTEPKMVYISLPTEFGTLYSLRELEDMRRVCDEYGLFLFVDGARLGYALGSEACDVSLRDLARLCDVFYIGGTKCGALFGEAVVIVNPVLQPHFRSYIKQNNGMLAKGWLLGLQFHTLFQDGLYFEINRQANDLAKKIRDAFVRKGILPYIESPTNQQFFAVTDAQMEYFAKKYVFNINGRTDAEHTLIRFCTSWSTAPEEVEALCASVDAL